MTSHVFLMVNLLFICDQEYPEPDYETIRDIFCITSDKPPLSEKVEEAIRLLVLNVDISFAELIKSLPKPGNKCPEARLGQHCEKSDKKILFLS